MVIVEMRHPEVGCGRPHALIVAACDRVRSTLGWQPRFDDLQTIIAHARAWERKLSKRAG
jgi:UDP-glucose 4-epimerase